MSHDVTHDKNGINSRREPTMSLKKNYKEGTSYFSFEKYII